MNAPQTLKNAQTTILVVDDDPLVLDLVSGVLADPGINILTAGNGPEAIKQSRSYELDIDLLLSDFQMPGMSGIDLATAISVDRPQIKVLLMSGFTAGMLVLNEGWHFLSKPFIPSQLRALVVGLLSPGTKSKSLQGAERRR